MRKKIMISGYHGYKNTGDEAVLESFLDYIKDKIPDIDIVVLSADPDFTTKNYGVRAIKRFDIFSIIKEFKNCDLLVSGGGSLLQDVTSSRTIPYYLSIIAIAKFLKVKVSIFAQGIGPVKRNFFKKWIRDVFMTVDTISVRDKGSLDFLMSIGLERSDIQVLSDPVFCLKSLKEKKYMTEIIDGNTIIFALRKWNDLICEDVFASYIDKINNDLNTKAVLLAFQPQEDLELSEKIANLAKSDVKVISYNISPKFVKQIISSSGLLVGMRLHSLILAASCNVACVGISYDPKVESLFEILNLNSMIKVEDIPKDDRFSVFLDLVKNTWYNRQNIQDKLKKTVPNLENDALKACDLAITPIYQR